MKDNVKVLYRGGEGEITEKKSRFIGTAHPVETEDEAEDFIEEIRKKYYDARHNCYAFVIGEDDRITRMSDDGEPAQSAGLPILNVLKNSEVKNACIVVTRYFGGTLLGTGGLFRAYTKAAIKALDASVIVEKCPAQRWKIKADYQDLGRIRNVAGNEGLYELGCEYTEKAVIDLLVPADEIERAGALIMEKTGARADISPAEDVSFALLDGEVILF